MYGSFTGDFAGQAVVGSALTISFKAEGDERQRLGRLLNELNLELDGDKVHVAVSRPAEQKTLQQNDYAWALMTKIGNHHEIRKNKFDVYHDMLQAHRVPDYVVVIPEAVPELEKVYRLVVEHNSVAAGKSSGVQCACYRGMSTFTKKELKTFIDGIVGDCEDLEIPTDPELYKQGLID